MKFFRKIGENLEKHHFMLLLTFIFVFIFIFIEIWNQGILKNFDAEDISVINKYFSLLIILLFYLPLLSLFKIENKNDILYGVVKYIIPIIYTIPILFLFDYVANLDLTPETSLLFLIGFLVSLLLIVLVYPNYVDFNIKNIEWKILIFTLAILFFITFSFQFVISLTGEKFYSVNLYEDEDDKKYTDIHCFNLDGDSIAGQRVICKLGANHKILNGSFDHNLTNGLGFSQKFNETINITIPINLSHTKFNINILDDNNNTINLIGNYKGRIPDYEEFKTNKKYFLGLIVGILAFCFISFPSALKTINELFQKKKTKISINLYADDIDIDELKKIIEKKSSNLNKKKDKKS